IERSEIWYKDGSVVLQAQGTQFRVHWGVLSQHSSFFREMEDLPQPPEQDSVEGCPVVELSDSAADVEHLLRTLYNPLFSNENVVPFPILASIVRLGRKYSFEGLLDAAVERLTFENPASLERYDALNRVAYSPSRYLHYLGIYYDTITLARENNLFSVLPSAYYRAIQKHRQASFFLLTTLFDGVTRGDGTFVTLLPMDQRRCVLGRERIMRAQFQAGNTLGWFQLQNAESPVTPCTTIAQCNRRRDATFRSFLLDPKLFALRTFNPMKDWRDKMCFHCRQQAQQSITAGRIKMWEELPGFFDLPPWTELKNEL
ncbi:hypothetical protein C8R44DRAFT_914756, partial [Mycena epipterygia]